MSEENKRFYRHRGTIWEADKSLSLGEVEDKLNQLYKERKSIAKGFDEFQAKLGYVIGKYARMYNRESDEFQLIECIADELGFDLESMEAKDGYRVD